MKIIINNIRKFYYFYFSIILKESSKYPRLDLYREASITLEIRKPHLKIKIAQSREGSIFEILAR